MARKYPEAKVGDRFGYWTVIAYWLPDVDNYNARRICVMCDCGFWRVHRENLIISGKTKSCGCKNRSAFAPISTKRLAQERREREAQVMRQLEALEINPFRKESRRETTDMGLVA